MPTLLSINNYHYFRGGAETVFLEHGRLLEHHGWSVVPFAMHHPRNLPTPWSEYFVDEIEFGSAYSPLEKARRAGRVIYSWQARERLGKLLDVVRPAVCHAHNIYHHISPSILGLLARRGVPVVLTLHDLKIACPAYNMLASDGICERCRGGRLYNVVTQRCIKQSPVLSSVVLAEAVLHRMLGSYTRNVSRFVVPSRFYIGKLIEWGWPAERFCHVPNFVDVKDYKPRVHPGDRFLYFGRLSREKGIQTLLASAARARVALTIVGTGPDLEFLQRTADTLGTDVKFRGFLTGTALHDAIREARAVVLPSEWYENAPMSVLEAYALGKPVIGARIGGIPELVQEGQTGLLFASGNIEALADALGQLQSMPDAQLAGMGQAGRDWIASEFSSERYLDRILALYRGLGAMHSPAVGRP